MFPRFNQLLTRQMETSDRAVLLSLRWLFFLVLGFLFLYSPGETSLPLRMGLLMAYAASNLALTWATRRRFSLQRWSMPIFLIDLILVGAVLYNSVGPDIDFYLMCFLLLYLSTLGRRVQDALPIALVACLLYGLLVAYRHPTIDFMDPTLLLRFPFFLVFSLFASYLSHQTEKNRKQIEQMRSVQHLLAAELQQAMMKLRDKQVMLLQAEKLSAMGTMAGALAHEIRNPLAVIIGYVEDLANEIPPPEVLKKILTSVLRSARRCQDLMSNLLNFARRPKETEHFNLKDALEETLTLVRMGAKMSQVQCLIEARSNPTIAARRGEIQQVLINLMSNAVDAMPRGGMLTIILEEERGLNDKPWVKVSVNDTGAGIPEHIAQHIFEPFYTTKPSGKGTGLGLSIVQDIIQDHQGLIELETHSGQGTTFIIHLPLEETPALQVVG